MRQATILIMVLAAVGCIADDDDDLAASEAASAPTHNPDNCPGGGSEPSGGGEPYPVPAPRDCTVETTHEACYACCDWNVDKVWGERCRRLPNRTKKDKAERARCWQNAERLRGECQAACPRPGPIVTFTGAP